MALATQCPHCQTTFRVVHDQLKLRAGLVRCGACKQIFNGIEHLLRPDHVAQTPLKNPPASASTPPAHTEVTTTFDQQKSAHQTTIGPAQPEVQDKQPASADYFPAAPFGQFDHTGIAETSNDPLQRMTLMDFTQVEDQEDHDENEEAAQDLRASPAADANGDGATDQSQTAGESAAPDELDRAIEDLNQKPWRSDNKSAEHDPADDMVAAESDEPGFVTLGRRRQRIGRTLRISMWSASIFLLFVLMGQSTYVFRNQLAAWFPQIKPALSTACELIDCQVALPTQIDAVSIESSELQALASQKDTFALTILLRNYSSTAQAWPNVELTLNDANEKALVRRIFTPRDYLPPKQDMAKGFAPNSEQPAKIPFELLQLKASGYRVYLFYP